MASKKPTDPLKAFASLKHHLKMPELPDPFRAMNKQIADGIRSQMADAPAAEQAAYQQAIDELENEAEDD